MALRNILNESDPILHKVCRPVEKFDERLWQLLDDMHETLDKAQGVGLAAPQVGFLRRLFIMSIGDDYTECINPKILEEKGGTASCKEDRFSIQYLETVCAMRSGQLRTGTEGV